MKTFPFLKRSLVGTVALLLFCLAFSNKGLRAQGPPPPDIPSCLSGCPDTLWNRMLLPVVSVPGCPLCNMVIELYYTNACGNVYYYIDGYTFLNTHCDPGCGHNTVWWLRFVEKYVLENGPYATGPGTIQKDVRVGQAACWKLHKSPTHGFQWDKCLIDRCCFKVYDVDKQDPDTLIITLTDYWTEGEPCEGACFEDCFITLPKTGALDGMGIRDKSAQLYVEAFPNPAASDIKLEFGSVVAFPMLVTVLSSTGEKSGEYKLPGGWQAHVLNNLNLAPGTYYFYISDMSKNLIASTKAVIGK